MIKIHDFILERMETGEYNRQYELAMELEINSGQLSHYATQRSSQPTLTVAKKIFKTHKVVIWPYSREAVEGEDGLPEAR